MPEINATQLCDNEISFTKGFSTVRSASMPCISA